ncbi:MAG: MFS transporter [Ectothiorhodospiraceae bacterium]|nr:MFS transporter [Ectothiorhodospiraceae bacterium]
MLAPLANPVYRRLFTAQVLSLLGAGLATVGLALLAFDLAGGDAGLVLGTALAVRMITNVVVAPIASAFAQRFPRRPTLIALDLVRAAVVLAFPFVDQVWQIYVLIFVLQCASAAFTPIFQAAIPDVLPDEDSYTRALTLSRLAYDLESLLSPTLAAAALVLVSFHWLFAGTSLGFLASAAAVMLSRLPAGARTESDQGVYARMTQGLRIYLVTPRLRGLLALNLTAAAAGAMVIVNTVVIVRGTFGGAESEVALANAVFGAGSIVAALTLPRLLEARTDRAVMVGGATLMLATLVAVGLVALTAGLGWGVLLAGWLALGLGYSAILTPSGRLLRRSAREGDRPSVFAAQFALSHACWLFTYPLAGWLGANTSLGATLLILAIPAAIGIGVGLWLWPRDDREVLPHRHDDLPADHPHLRDGHAASGGRHHAHPYVIDSLHRCWPRPD